MTKNLPRTLLCCLMLATMTVIGISCQSTPTDDTPKIPGDTTTIKPPVEHPEDSIIPISDKRTVLIFIHADHDLYSYMYGYLNKIEAGWAATDAPGQLLVYFYPNEEGTELGREPRLYRIHHDKGLLFSSPVIKTYPRHDPLDPAVMRMIIEDAMAAAPSKSYGLCFASHGYGWVPEDRRDHVKTACPYLTPEARMARGTLGFGRKMEGWDLVHEALPADVTFDFVAFNACLMGSVELIYEFKDKCRYMIASAAEMMGLGYPYTESVQKLFGPVDSLVDFAKTYYNFHQDLFISQSATIGVVDCSKLSALAQATAAVVGNPIDSIPGSQIQYFRSADNEKLFFDFEDFIVRTWGKSAKQSELDGFQRALNDAVIYKAATPTFFGLPIKAHCGMSSYVPYHQHPYYTQVFCTKYKWGDDSGLSDVANRWTEKE